MTQADPAKPWSSPLAVSDVPANGLDVRLVADDGVRARLAAANGLAGLASVEAALHVARRGREGLQVTGEVRARATLTCVVTLEPFETKIAEPVDVEFEPQASLPAKEPKAGERRGRAAREVEDEEGMDDLNAPDPIVDGKIDLGALAAEFLTLGIDPYPRKPGVAFEDQAEEPARESPFARLAAIAAKAGDNK